MALEITGKVQQILEVQSGEGRNGTWQKGGFVLETGDNFPKSVCCTVWGDMISQVQALQPGDMVKTNIDIQSREFNGRWYTDVKSWKIDKLESTPVTTTTGGGTPPQPPAQPADNAGGDANNEDDLPF